MDIDFALKEYGLSDKEIKVYITLLSLGSINLQEIAKKVDLPRTTIYNTLNYLVSKGLVSFIVKGNVRFYEAVNPEKLISKIDEKRELIKEIIPNLQGLRETQLQSSSAEIFEGTKGLSTILSDVFKKRQQTYYFGSYLLSKELLKYQPEHVRTIRIERKIPAKIVIDTYDEPTFHTKEYKKITEMRFNDSLRDFPCVIFIYGNKVAMYTLKKDIIGIIISNEQVAQSMKMIFDIYWQTGKPARL